MKGKHKTKKKTNAKYGDGNSIIMNDEKQMTLRDTYKSVDTKDDTNQNHSREIHANSMVSQTISMQ